LKTAWLFLISVVSVFVLSAGCSSPAKTNGTTIQFTRPPTSSTHPAESTASKVTSVGGGTIGGLSTGGKPALMTHPVKGFENCISCHGVAGSAQHLVYETAHPCEQCHAMVPEPSWGPHDNNAVTDLPRINASCTMCHKPVTG
jgi:hypothetical protein